jgi:uncharacterized membrane protein
MMTRTKLYWTIALTVTVATWVVSAALYTRFPATVPTHWDIHGRVDGYGPKSVGLFLLPALLPLWLVFFAVLPAISPKNFEVEPFRETYLFLMVVIVGLFAYLHGVILLAIWQQVTKAPHPLDIGRTISAGAFLFLAVIGNVFGKLRRNFYMGIRVPWTLASDRVWNDTHRLAAWTTVAGSLVGFVLTVAGFSLVIALAVLAASFLIPVVYSFVHYKRLERQGAL